MAGHHAEKHGRDRGDRGEESLRIADDFIHVTGQQIPIDVVAHVLAGKQAARLESRNGNEFERGPVTQQQADGRQELVARPRVQGNQGGENISQPDPPQHAGKADGSEIRHQMTLSAGTLVQMQREVEVQNAVDHQAQKNEHDSPANDPPMQLRRAVPLGKMGGEGKGDGHADDEHEQRKNQIVERKTVPLRVFSVPEGDRAKRFRATQHGKRLQHVLSADDPEHVEAAQARPATSAASQRATSRAAGSASIQSSWQA